MTDNLHKEQFDLLKIWTQSSELATPERFQR